MRLNQMHRPIEILLVEDSPTDALFTQEAFEHSALPNHISLTETGVDAISFLHHDGAYSEAPRPDLILLDWNLPLKHGRDVLREIKEDPELRTIPVLVLTTSQAEDDVLTAYNLHANCYVAKPVNYDRFIEVTKAVEDFWFTIVNFSPGEFWQ